MKFLNVLATTGLLGVLAFKVFVLSASTPPTFLQVFLDAKEGSNSLVLAELDATYPGKREDEVCTATWLDTPGIFKDNTVSSAFWNSYYQGGNPETMPWWVFLKRDGKITAFFEIGNKSAMPLAASFGYLRTHNIPIPEHFQCVPLADAKLNKLYLDGNVWLYLSKL